MLGRAAGNLFWMARSMERVENIVRLLVSSRNASMLSEHEGQDNNVWNMPLEISAQKAKFLDEYHDVNEGRVTAFMLCDGNNPASVKSQLKQARENARATRHFLTAAVWECINRTWLIVKDTRYQDLQKSSVDDYLEWLIDRCYMFKGVLSASMRRGEGLYFSNLGLCIERADHSARMMSVHFYNSQLSQSQSGIMEVRDYYRSLALLNSLNAYKAYREAFHSSIELDKIAELFILHKELPRSLRGCLDEMVDILRTLNPTSSTLKEVYELQYRLDSVQIAQLRRVGLEYFLLDFTKYMDEISLKIQRDFMMVQ